MNQPDTHSEAVFKHLVKRNAINFYAEKAACEVVTANQSEDQIVDSVRDWLSNLSGGQSLKSVKLPETRVLPCYSPSDMQRALLLIGSPKTSKSTSNSLGEYLFKVLGAQSIQTEKIYLHTTIRSSEKMKTLMETVDTMDLVTLAFPLYVDSQPAPVIDALEQIATNRQSRKYTHKPMFTAISNCGFPEAMQIATAQAICEIFAEQAEFQWAGGLALGGGHGLGEKPLEERGGRTSNIRKALELAADTLAHGQCITKEAQDLISKPLVPSWFPFWAYRLIGGFGWKQQAKQYGVQKSLDRQPYLE
jgi:hypothetical protein